MVMITCPEFVVVKQQGCTISYWRLLGLGVIVFLLFLFVPDTEGVIMFELRAARRACTPLIWSLFFHHYQLPAAKQLYHQSIYRVEVTDHHHHLSSLLFDFGALLLQAQLNAAFICLKSFSI